MVITSGQLSEYNNVNICFFRIAFNMLYVTHLHTNINIVRKIIPEGQDQTITVSNERNLFQTIITIIFCTVSN